MIENLGMIVHERECDECDEYEAGIMEEVLKWGDDGDTFRYQSCTGDSTANGQRVC